MGERSLTVTGCVGTVKAGRESKLLSVTIYMAAPSEADAGSHKGYYFKIQSLL